MSNILRFPNKQAMEWYYDSSKPQINENDSYYHTELINRALLKVPWNSLSTGSKAYCPKSKLIQPVRVKQRMVFSSILPEKQDWPPNAKSIIFPYPYGIPDECDYDFKLKVLIGKRSFKKDDFIGWSREEYFSILDDKSTDQKIVHSVPPAKIEQLLAMIGITQAGIQPIEEIIAPAYGGCFTDFEFLSWIGKMNSFIDNFFKKHNETLYSNQTHSVSH